MKKTYRILNISDPDRPVFTPYSYRKKATAAKALRLLKTHHPHSHRKIKLVGW